jgi:hypothetical protein
MDFSAILFRMATTLDIRQIEEIASAQLEVAKRIKELEALLQKSFPGFKVYIEKREGRQEDTRKDKGGVTASLGAKISHLSSLEQMEHVLRQIRTPMSKQDLCVAIRERGGHVGIDTITSYLSRFRNTRFKSYGHGVWGLAEGTVSNGTEVFST